MNNKNLLIILIIGIILVIWYINYNYTNSYSEINLSKLKELPGSLSDLSTISKKSNIYYMITKNDKPKLITVLKRDKNYELSSRDFDQSQSDEIIKLHNQDNINRINKIINKKLLLLEIMKIEKLTDNELIEVLVMEPGNKITKLTLKLDNTGRKLLEGFADECPKIEIVGDKISERIINNSTYLTTLTRNQENKIKAITLKTNGNCSNIVSNILVKDDDTYDVPKKQTNDDIDKKRNIYSINIKNYNDKQLYTQDMFTLGYRVLSEETNFKNLAIVGFKYFERKEIVEWIESTKVPTTYDRISIITIDPYNTELIIEAKIIGSNNKETIMFD